MASSAYSIDIQEIVKSLKRRQRLQQKTVLVLGAKTSGLFRSILLRELVKMSFSSSSFTVSFGECYKSLADSDFFDSSLIDAILIQSLYEVDISQADLYLATLVKMNFFNPIITTSIDNTFEQALVRVGMRELKDFSISSIPSSTGKDPTSFDNNIPHSVLKVFGQLTARDHIIKRNAYLSQNEYQASILKNYLNRNVLLIGLDSLWDAELFSIFPKQGSSFWYVNDDTIEVSSTLYTILHARNAKYMVSEVAVFIKELYSQLVPSPPVEGETPVEPQLSLFIETPVESPKHSTSFEPILRMSMRAIYDDALSNLKALVISAERTAPTCFISYAWDDVNHQRWVDQLTNDLESSGIQPVFDQWHNARIGSSIPRFITKISQCDFTLVIGTPSYLKKYDNQVSPNGSVVSAEMDLMGILLIGTEKRKEQILPLLREGEARTSFPPSLLGRTYADFVQDEDYFSSLFDLVITLYALDFADHRVRDLRNKLREGRGKLFPSK